MTTKNILAGVIIILAALLIGSIVYTLASLQTRVGRLEAVSREKSIIMVVTPTLEPTATPAGTLKTRVVIPTVKTK